AAPKGQLLPGTSQAPGPWREGRFWRAASARQMGRRAYASSRSPSGAVMTVEMFADRHIGPDAAQTRRMLEVVGYGSVAELMDAAVPEQVRWRGQLDLPPAATEAEVTAELRALAAKNQVL